MKKIESSKLLSLLIIISVSTFLFLSSCSKESPTEPEPSPQPIGEASLLLSKLSVAMVPGGTETVDITATSASNTTENCSVSCDDPDVASVSLSNSVLTVTGINYGTTTITVTSQSGKKRTIPVNIYNSKVLDTGELEIAFVDTFQFRGSYDSPLTVLPNSFWQPVTRDGFQALGSIALDYNSNPNGKEWMMVVKAKEGTNALANPISYTKIYQGGAGSYWRPNPPDGYVALGTDFTTSYVIPPSLNDVVCVREDLTITGTAGSFIWRIPGWNGNNAFICWKIDPPNTTDPVAYDQLVTGTFVALGSAYSDVSNMPPTVNPTMNVLKANLPLLSEAPPQTFQPKLEGYDTPAQETVPTFSRAVLVPCTSIIDDKFGSDVNLKIENSPFYRLEREVYYKLLYFNYNKTSQVQTNSVTITSGIENTQSQSYSTTTGVTISVEAGINVGLFSGKASTTLSKTFGYEQLTSVTELQQKSVQTSINIAPNKAAAVWQQYNRFVLYRHNGTKLEIVGTSCEFGIDSYVTDEYPD